MSEPNLPMTNSVRDLKPTPEHAGRRLRDLTTRLEYLERRGALLEDIVLSLNSVAVCDFCHEAWFLIGREPCDPSGLLAGEGACCTGCLDRLHEKTSDMDEGEAAAVERAVLAWLERFPQNRRLTQFGRGQAGAAAPEVAMLRPRDLRKVQLVAIVGALQEAFYLDRDEDGSQVWDPDSDVPGAELVETMGFHLEHAGLKPSRKIPAA
jgi:hypothetical protein